MKMEQCSETSAYKIQTPGNYPEENMQHTEHGESLVYIYRRFEAVLYWASSGSGSHTAWWPGRLERSSPPQWEGALLSATFTNGHVSSVRFWRSRIQYIFSVSVLGYEFFLWHCDPTRAMASFIHIRRIAVGRTPLDEWSARRRDLYLTTQQTNIHAPYGIRTHDRSRRAAADLRLRPRGHWDRHKYKYNESNHGTINSHIISK